MKLAIIGIGHVGSSLAYAIVLKGLCTHLLLANRNIKKARGNALDLQHMLSFCDRPMIIESGAIDEVKDYDIVVITASAQENSPITSRIELAPANIKLFKQIIPILAYKNPKSIFIIITNPVDVLTYFTTQLAGFHSSKIMGVGTLVDSARFRALLSVAELIHPDDMRTYILGEHGPSQFPVFSNAFAGSERITDNPCHRRIFQEVNHAGFDVYKLKGYTNYAIATAACEVIKTIVYDDHRTMPLSTYFDEWNGIQNNCFSIPVVVGRAGIIRYLHPELNPQERIALEETARSMREHIDKYIHAGEI